MHGNDVVVLAGDTTPNTSQFLHVCSNTQQQTQVHTERSDICSRLTRHPEDTEVSVVVVLDQFRLVNRPDSQLPLDGGDQRWSLEKRTSKGLERTGKGLFAANLVVESDDTDVLLSGSLLGLDKTSGSVDTDNQASGNLRVERSRVTGLLHAENTLEPGNNFVRGRVGGLVKVDNTRLDVGLQITLERADSLDISQTPSCAINKTYRRDRGEVRRSNEQFIVVLQQQRPLRSV